MAMSSINPIKFEKLFNIKQLGINDNSVTYNGISMESDKCIVIKEESKLSIIDITSRKLNTLNIGRIDSAKMNPSTNVLGIQSHNNLQIFNLSMKTKIKSIEANDNILYWRWLDSRTISYITTKAAYHWSMEVDSKPQKKFDIIPDERKIQCINYDSSSDGNWLFLQAIAKSTHNHSIEGVLQLFNVASKKYQPKMNALGGCFAHLNINNRDNTLFCFTRQEKDNVTKLFIVEIGNNDSNALKIQTEIKFEQANDFIISMIPSDKYGCIYAISQQGYLYIFDLLTAKQIYYRRVSNVSIFYAVAHSENGGIIICDKNGTIVSITINPNNYVSYIMNELNDKQMALSIAMRYNLTGADHIFKMKFKELISHLQYEQAVRFAVEAPREILRTPEVIELLEQAPNTAYPPPDLQFYTLLLQNGSLNKIESIGLCKRILNAKPTEGIVKIEKFLKEQKLYYSEDLGDLLVAYSAKLAATVYYKAKIPSKTILCFIKCGNSDRIIQYCISENYIPNWTDILRNVLTMDKENVIIFAKQLIEKNYLEAMDVVNALLGFGTNNTSIEKTTEFLLMYLNDRDDQKEDHDLQTKLFEINLKAAPQIADALFGEGKFSNYDRNYIAQLCERAKLYHRALEHFESLDDIKRVLQAGITANTLTKDFLLTYFGELTPEDALQCLQDLLVYQSTQFHMRIVVEVAIRYNDELKTERLIHLFEDNDSWMGLYLFLSNIINVTQDKQIVYKYIVAATQCKLFEQLRNICADNNHYDPDEVKTYLLENGDIIKDPRPLIHVCDRFGFIAELTRYLYSNQMYKFIEAYIHKMNESATPKVIGGLLDLNCPEEQIKGLLRNVRPPQCSITELIEEIEKRDRLNMLLPWLEARYNEKIEDTSLHNALCKIYVNINNNPIHFLMTNKFYDHEIVGIFCESRDPRLAFAAYKQSDGKCDQLLINVSNTNGFYKDLAKYCMERNDLKFWNEVLNQDEEKEQAALIDQVISDAIAHHSTSSEQISTLIKAFMQSDLPNELIQLLEKIIFADNSHNYNFNNFNKNENLQTLLMLTAIKADPTRIIGYIERLDNYDAINIANVCKQENYKLFEEAFLIYKKCNHNVEAVHVLLNNFNDLERAKEFAVYCNEACVWSILGKSQLDNDLIDESISSFLQANDAQYYNDIIFTVNQYDKIELYKELIKFLLMARDNNKVRDKKIDSEILYCYAKINDLTLFDTFISNNPINNTSLSKIGDRLFDESFFDFAKIVFERINNYSKLALCLIQVQQFKEAVDSCTKANCIQTWKNVCFACVDAEKFKLAQMCGVHIIIFMDHLYDLIKYYEINGHFAELINLLEHGINLDKTHQGIYTALGILYAKYNENKLMEHIKLFWNRLNICQLINICLQNQHWKESVFLYKKYNQYDNAAEIMVLHSSKCWDHDEFKSILINVGIGCDILYKAIQFYLNEHPLKLSEILIEINTKLDHKRVIHTIQFANKLSLIKDYLLFIQQRNNNESINEAINRLFVEEDDYKSLRESIEQYDKFDQIALAQTLQKHELLEFRRMSAYLYRINKRYKTSIELSKEDKLWEDIMDTGALSNDYELVEELLRYFVTNIETEECPKSCFTACLFTCFDVIKPDVVLELSWKHNLFEYSMPYLVQSMKRFNDKFNSLHRTVDDLRQKLDSFAQTEMNKENNWNNNIQPMMPMIDYIPHQQHTMPNNNMNNNSGGLGLM